jgi:formylglycine-generating enzyme required for sulfatase activity
MMATTETSNGAYRRLMTNLVMRVKGANDLPVVSVTWREATNFAHQLTRWEQSVGRLKPKQAYRLATDGEWNAAAGLSEADPGKPAPQRWWWLSPEKPPQDANFAGEEWKDNRRYRGQEHLPGFRDFHAELAPARSMGTNQFGIYHMPGNVREWVLDSDERGQHWPRGAAYDSTTASDLNCFARPRFRSHEHRPNVGIRLVFDLGE